MRQIALDIGLAPAPTLESFLAGPNAAALAHLRQVAPGGALARVPTYLWGDSGSGKTHLLQALRQAWREQGLQVGWLDASQPLPDPFAPAWSAVLMDDVQHYDEARQALAFQWFVEAMTPEDGRSRWVLAAGTLPPADLPLREDLRTRLGWGHVFELRVLSEAERRAVLRQEADARGIFLSDEVMDFMLSRFSRDLASLMQLLRQLDGYALAHQRGVTIPLIRAMLAEA